jgi:hypothetical protein
MRPVSLSAVASSRAADEPASIVSSKVKNRGIHRWFVVGKAARLSKNENVKRQAFRVFDL